MEHTTLKRQIEHIRNLMASGKVEEAIDELRSLSNTIRDSATKDEIIAISSKFNRLERDLRNQVISTNDLNLKHNQLTSQVLSLLSGLEESYERITGNKPGVSTSTNSSTTTSNQRPAWLIPGVIALLLIVALGSWWLLSDRGEEVSDNCTELIERARTAYFADDFTTARTLLDNLPAACRNKGEVGQLNKKVSEAIARETGTATTPDRQDDPPATPSTTTTQPEEDREAEDKKWCNDRYLEAVNFLQQKNYSSAKAAVRSITERCGANERVTALLNRIEEASRPAPVENRPIKSFMLHFPNAYLVHSGSNTQLITGNPISYGQDWEVKKLKPFLYHVKQAKWRDFFWQVNTSREEVQLVRGGTFGSMGGTQSKERMRVVSFPNKETPTRFQLYFDDCYLIHSPPNTVQVAGSGKVLQREDNWEVKKISSSVYHLKSDAWRTNLFWKADLDSKKATMFRGTAQFGNANAESSERVDARVEVKY